MKEISIQALKKALAFADAALDETTPHRVAEAKLYAEVLLPPSAIIKPHAFTLGEARYAFELVGQLRAVLAILDRKLAHTLQLQTN